MIPVFATWLAKNGSVIPLAFAIKQLSPPCATTKELYERKIKRKNFFIKKLSY